MSQGQTSTDVILIGAGIMSATLGTLLKELAPDWNIKVLRSLPRQEKKARMSGTMPEPGMLRCANLTILLNDQTKP